MLCSAARLRWLAWLQNYCCTQDWIASVRVPSEEATALSHMADAAAAAAAYSTQGTAGHSDTMFERARRAELAKRAQQASDAVLRGDGAVGSHMGEARQVNRYDMHR